MNDDTLLEAEAIVSLNDILRDYTLKNLAAMPSTKGVGARNPFEIFDEVESAESRSKQWPPKKVDGDVLALVLYWNSINLTSKDYDSSPMMYWCSILRSMTELYAQDDYDIVMAETFLDGVPITPTKENYEKAAQILDYYRLKLSHRALMGGEPFSEYETKLAGFINTPVGEFDMESLGVIVRLETTFDVDATLDGFMDKYTSLPVSANKYGPWGKMQTSRDTRTLKFLKKVNVLGNKDNNIRYYFEKDDDNSLYCIKLGEKNPLLGVLDYVLESKNNMVTITSSIGPQKMYANSNFWYCIIGDGFKIE